MRKVAFFTPLLATPSVALASPGFRPVAQKEARTHRNRRISSIASRSEDCTDSCQERPVRTEDAIPGTNYDAKVCNLLSATRRRRFWGGLDSLGSDLHEGRENAMDGVVERGLASRRPKASEESLLHYAQVTPTQIAAWGARRRGGGGGAGGG